MVLKNYDNILKCNIEIKYKFINLVRFLLVEITLYRYHLYFFSNSNVSNFLYFIKFKKSSASLTSYFMIHDTLISYI